jgi:cytochrome c551/c552
LPDTPNPTPEQDPVVSSSLAVYLLLTSLLLILVLGWSLYDEFFGLRPWKDYQRSFTGRYATFLRKQIPKQRAKEQAIQNSPDFLALKQKLAELQQSTNPRVKELDERSAGVEARTAAVLNRLTEARAYVGSRIYVIDHIDYRTQDGIRKRQELQKELQEYERGPFEIAMPAVDRGGRNEVKRLTFEQLEEQFNLLQQEKAKLLLEKAALLKPVSELQAKVESYVKDHIDGLTVEALRGLQNKNADFTVEVKQINSPDAGVVDRCESCHVGIREPAVITHADMPGAGGKPDELSAAFTSHPEMALLKIHDPDKFGCTPCHNGNGMNISHVEKAHGYDEHWLWPLHPKENIEAGCQQCHANDMVVDHARVLSRGKELFEWRGCMGCHRFQGYDSESEDLVSTQRGIEQLGIQRGQFLLDIDKNIKAGDNAPDNEAARKYYAQADNLRLAISNIDLQSDQLNRKIRFLQMDRKKVGPDLKEVRAKLRPEWIPVWIQNPHAFRPTTRMPRFRLADDEVRSIAAFVWQSALDAKAATQAPGDPAKGKESFEARGCMGCHAVGEGASAVGGWFGANLTRVGEKSNYDYLVRWIHNPRERSAPYCPFEKRDLTADDYKKHNLPYVFDLEHTKCPNDGHELVVEQMTIMPNLRLSWEESRDIASYLMTLKQKEASSYAPASFLTDSQLKAKGELLVRRYGCSGCHEIAGFEEEGRIGTELTVEGSKALEQLDFALYVDQAKDQDWWTHKGFFERKLAKPEMFDEGMVKTPDERLRMPDFFEPASSKVVKGKPELAPEASEQITALTTFLMGSVTSEIPLRYWYLPAEQKKDIQDGWWVVKKYNCMGCHQFTLDQQSVLMTLTQYQTPDGKGQLPPRLVTEGARVGPEWLARFLANPALSEKDTDRDGVRNYLKARMPTFYFSPIEIQKLVRFFQALSMQPIPYIPQKLAPLTTAETEMARALFTSKGAPCLKCHAIGAPAHDKYASAPNFLLASDRLKPDWVTHWILDPAMIDPGTAMPSGLFRQQAGHWVFNGPTPPIFKGYEGDQANLLMRYLFELTPAEQQRLIQMTGGSLNRTPSKASLSSPRRRRGPREAVVGMLR